MGARATKQDICKHFNINKFLLKLSRNTVLHPFKIEINKQRTDVNRYMNCSNFSAFPPFFPSEKVKLDSFVVAAVTAQCLALLVFPKLKFFLSERMV